MRVEEVTAAAEKAGGAGRAGGAQKAGGGVDLGAANGIRSAANPACVETCMRIGADGRAEALKGFEVIAAGVQQPGTKNGEARFDPMLSARVISVPREKTPEERCRLRAVP